MVGTGLSHDPTRPGPHGGVHRAVRDFRMTAPAAPVAGEQVPIHGHGLAVRDESTWECQSVVAIGASSHHDRGTASGRPDQVSVELSAELTTSTRPVSASDAVEEDVRRTLNSELVVSKPCPPSPVSASNAPATAASGRQAAAKSAITSGRAAGSPPSNTSG